MLGAQQSLGEVRQSDRVPHEMETPPSHLYGLRSAQSPDEGCPRRAVASGEAVCSVLGPAGGCVVTALPQGPAQRDVVVLPVSTTGVCSGKT